MKKLILSIFLVTVLVSMTVAATMLIPVSDKAKEKAEAQENSPVIKENWELERIDFIHYVKPDWAKGKGKEPECYKLLRVKWKSLPVDYTINPTNSGLPKDFVATAISTSAETWDTETSAELFNDEYTVDYNVNYGNQDYINTLDFGDYPDDRVIAVTTIWYTPRGRQIVEFDILFNTRFTWGNADSDSTLMDLQNIAVHEIGHGAGLDDIYDDVCSEVTMYGYSDYGETKKRTLEQPDITGIQELYGI